MAPIVSLLIIEQKPFCLSASPDKQKILSLRPRRLCGENVILDKHGFGNWNLKFCNLSSFDGPSGFRIDIEGKTGLNDPRPGVSSILPVSTFHLVDEIDFS